MNKILALLMIAAFWAGFQTASAQIYADTVLYNGQILTADSDDAFRFTIAQAVAIYDGKFVAATEAFRLIIFSVTKSKWKFLINDCKEWKSVYACRC